MHQGERMKRAYYTSTISDFLTADEDFILGQLLINDEFETSDLQKNSWRREIQILREQLSSFPNGEIAFELFMVN